MMISHWCTMSRCHSLGEATLTHPIRIALAAFAVSLTGCAQAQEAKPIPSPPVTGREFFNETYLSHSMKAECLGVTAQLDWKYRGERPVITSLSFRGMPAPAAEIERMNGWISDIAGDMTVFMQCDHNDVQFDFVPANTIAREKMILIRIVWTGEEAKFVRKISWDRPDG